jgi:hypothetical protein
MNELVAKTLELELDDYSTGSTFCHVCYADSVSNHVLLSDSDFAVWALLLPRMSARNEQTGSKRSSQMPPKVLQNPNP